MPAQIIGPDWLGDVRLDIIAKTVKPVGDKQLYLMLRTLLVERMGLKRHVEKRDAGLCSNRRKRADQSSLNPRRKGQRSPGRTREP
jgi:hypothetical protein